MGHDRRGSHDCAIPENGALQKNGVLGNPNMPSDGYGFGGVESFPRLFINNGMRVPRLQDNPRSQRAIISYLDGRTFAGIQGCAFRRRARSNVNGRSGSGAAKSARKITRTAQVNATSISLNENGCIEQSHSVANPNRIACAANGHASSGQQGFSHMHGMVSAGHPS